MKWWLYQVFRASSRLLNALTGGEGDTTFSAYSWELKRRGSLWGKLRVSVIDRIAGYDHCLASWEWHEERRLFEHD
jgi:hypothetical protein